MDLTFFGLTSEIAKQVRVNLFTQIHEKYYDEKNGEKNGDLDAQTSAIKDGKIQIPDHFKGKLEQKAPKY